jgi:carboxymethylenebutenolidase
MKALFLLTIFFQFQIGCLFGQDFALKQLENSPRHHEWVEINYDSRSLYSFVAFPEIPGESIAVVLIHENRGLTDWVRSFADQLAAEGFLVIAPDFLSGFNEEYQKTEEFPDSDEARKAIYELDPEQITSGLKAVVDYISSHGASNGKVVVAGFCWGGSQSFRFATNTNEIEAAMVFYGSPPETKAELSRVTCPVYGFYGENDARINNTIPATENTMDELDLVYDYVIYEGAGHAFMRRGDDPDGEEMNKKAREEAFQRMIKIMNSI